MKSANCLLAALDAVEVVEDGGVTVLDMREAALLCMGRRFDNVVLFDGVTLVVTFAFWP